jgi:lipoprotein-releasing system ATP-binding protein
VTLLLEARGIFKSFQKGDKNLQVLGADSGLNLALEPKQTAAIVGASGAGKSTLLHILGGLECPTRGQVFFLGEDIFRFSEGMRAEFRNKSLGFVFQFHYLLPELTALENVLMPLMIGQQLSPRTKAQAIELLEFVGLKDRLEHRPSELSGGEQQRVAIARAVVMRPKLILADEPTGNLDSANRSKILELLVELHRLTEVGILLVTHDMLLAGKMKHIFQMRDGTFFS